LGDFEDLEAAPSVVSHHLATVDSHRRRRRAIVDSLQGPEVVGAGSAIFIT